MKIKRLISVILSIMLIIPMTYTNKSHVSAQITLTEDQILSALDRIKGKSNYGEDLCLTFVDDFWQSMGGYRTGGCCPHAIWDSLIISTSLNNIPIGADVFFENSDPNGKKCENGHICGHIGIYIGNGQIIDLLNGIIGEHTIDYYNHNNWSYRGWGVHPGIYISGADASVLFHSDSITNITANDATISTWVTNNNGEIFSTGFWIGTSEDNMHLCTTHSHVGWTEFYGEYKISDYFDYLSPGTQYFYKYYLISADGMRYYESKPKTFTTSGSADITFDTNESIVNSSDTAQLNTWVRNHNGKTIKSYGIYFGNSLENMTKIELNSNVSWTDFHIKSDLIECYKQLTPSTEYYYCWYVDLNDYTYYSGIFSFITTEDIYPPLIQKVYTEELTPDGFTLVAKISDNVGVEKVLFETWKDGANEKTSVTANHSHDDYYCYRFNISDFNNETGLYHANVYAFDKRNMIDKTTDIVVPVSVTTQPDKTTTTTTTSTTTTQKPTTTTTTSTTTTQKPTTTTTTSTTTTQKPTTTTTTSTTTTQKPTTTTTTSTTTTQKPTTTTTTSTTTTQNSTTTTTTSTTTTQKPTTTTTNSFHLENTDISLSNGDQYTIPLNLNDITYKSTNTDVAVVSPKGIITAVGIGEAIINIIDKDYNVIQLKVSVKSDNHEQISYELGDVNNDGQINALDASSVLSYYAMISTNKDGGYNDNQIAAADVNHDGQVNAVDASSILAYYAYVSTTKEDILPIDEYLKKK